MITRLRLLIQLSLACSLLDAFIPASRNRRREPWRTDVSFDEKSSYYLQEPPQSE